MVIFLMVVFLMDVMRSVVTLVQELAMHLHIVLMVVQITQLLVLLVQQVQIGLL
jgi:hypothetical protein